jgi:hypothetical protein
MAQREDFVAELRASRTAAKLDAALKWTARQRAGGNFEEDVSLVELSVT